MNAEGEAAVSWANAEALNLLGLTADEAFEIVIRAGVEFGSPAASLMDSPIRRNLTSEDELAALEDWKEVVLEAIDGRWNAYPPEWRPASIETTDRSHDVVEVMVTRALDATSPAELAEAQASGPQPASPQGAPASYAVWRAYQNITTTLRKRVISRTSLPFAG